MLRALGIASLTAAALCACLALACATPTLPLPPPSAPLVGPPDAMGLVTVTGEALADAYVSCLNERTQAGVIVRADAMGLYSLQIAAVSGDFLTIWQQLGSDLSPPVDRTVP